MKEAVQQKWQGSWIESVKITQLNGNIYRERQRQLNSWLEGEGIYKRRASIRWE